MVKDYEILGSKWWTPPTPNLVSLGQQPIIGCVAILSLDTKPRQWKCYMGIVDGTDSQETGEQQIARYGMPIGSKEAACALFPFLSPNGYRK